jgi:hypothetical protein
LNTIQSLVYFLLAILFLSFTYRFIHDYQPIPNHRFFIKCDLTFCWFRFVIYFFHWLVIPSDKNIPGYCIRACNMIKIITYHILAFYLLISYIWLSLSGTDIFFKTNFTVCFNHLGILIFCYWSFRKKTLIDYFLLILHLGFHCRII